MNLYNVKESHKNRIKRRKAGRYDPITKKNHGRFYSQLDMSIIKHDISVKNSEIKRGEKKDEGNHYIAVCGCGGVGCFIHGSFKTSV